MKKVSVKLRREVIDRANGFCEYCRSNSVFSDSPFDVEHITPLALGGKTVSENLALSCHGCNLHKSNKISGFDVISDEIARLLNPRTDLWHEHFVWANNFAEIVGLTKTGRATVEVMKLNRKGLVNQRKLLVQLGEHSPNKI